MVVLLGPLVVYLMVCVADARSYAARMEHQRQRRDGLQYLGKGTKPILEPLVAATIGARRAGDVTEQSVSACRPGADGSRRVDVATAV